MELRAAGSSGLLCSIPKGAGVCDRAKQVVQTLLAPPSAKLSFFYMQRLLKAREDSHFSLKTQINTTVRYGVDAIRAVFFSLLTLPAVHFLNKSTQKQSPGDSAAFPEGISMDSAWLLVRSCATAAPCAGLQHRATPPLSEPS